jgi:hypothetical protein
MGLHCRKILLGHLDKAKGANSMRGDQFVEKQLCDGTFRLVETFVGEDKCLFMP